MQQSSTIRNGREVDEFSSSAQLWENRLIFAREVLATFLSRELLGKHTPAILDSM